MILLDAVIINGRQYSFGRTEPMGIRIALIDTGTGTIKMPLTDFNRIGESIPGAKINTTPEGSYISADCNTQLNFFLTFGGVNYRIDRKDLLYGSIGNNMCVFKLVCSADARVEREWILGVPFLQN